MTSFTFPGRKQVQIKFCPCSPNDQVRLIQAGFIEGTPVNPQSVITIRLLRFFHTAWKSCSLRFQPFSEALNELLDLDNGNPLFLNRKGTAVSMNFVLSFKVLLFKLTYILNHNLIHSHVNGIALCLQP